MDEQQSKGLAHERRRRKRQRDLWLRDLIENLPLFWIFDSQLDEIYRIHVRETAQKCRRMKIRYFFSWEGLSKFLLVPVFKVGLTSILVTPFIASIYMSLLGTFGTLFNYRFPIQMGLLFFSGTFVIIARIFYEVFCPRLVKAYIKPSTLDMQNLQKAQWLQTELEHCLLHYVYKLSIDEDYVIGQQIRKMQRKEREGSKEENDPPGYSSIVPELAEYRVGFDKCGVWLIENLLLRLATEKKHKLFVSWGRPPYKFHECRYPEAAWDRNYTALHFLIFELAYKDMEEPGISEGDFLLKIHEARHNTVDDFPKDAFIHIYFHGVESITNSWSHGVEHMTDVGTHNIISEFIAENQNYWRPCGRIVIAIMLLLSILFLLSFFVIQTLTVWDAIFY